MKCSVLFCVYLCVCRVSKLADSQKGIQPMEPLSLNDQEVRQDLTQDVIMPRNDETPVFSRLNEIATIKFNTGVSIFTKNLNLLCLAWVKMYTLFNI